MTGENETAFFNFGTNIQMVQAEIAAGLQSINRSLSQPLQLSTQGLTQLQGAFGAGFVRLNDEVMRGKEQIRAAMQDLSTGAISPAQFRDRIRDTMRGSLAGIPQIMAQEIGDLEAAVAKKVPARQIAASAAAEFRAALVGEFNRVRGEHGIKAMDFRFLDAAERRVAANPVAYGSESPEQYLRNRLLAENLVRQWPDKQLPAAQAELEKQLGISALTSQLRGTPAQGGIVIPTQKGYQLAETDTADQLRALQTAERDAAATAAREQRERSQAQAKADAERQVAEDRQRQYAEQLNREYDRDDIERQRLNHREALQAYNDHAKEREQAEDAARREAERINREYDQRKADVEASDRREATQRNRDFNRDQIESERLHMREALQIYKDHERERENLASEAERRDRARALEMNQRYDAERVLADGTRVSTSYRDSEGNYFRRAGAGVEPITNPATIAELEEHHRNIQANAASTARLLERWGEVVPIGKYRFLGNEIYELSRGQARRLTGELEINEALRAREAFYDRESNKAARQATLESQRALRERQHNSGLLGGAVGRFTRGDTAFMTGLGSQIASAAGFSLAYGSLFALQHAMRDTLNEFLDYQDSVTDLEVATRSADLVTSDWVNSLSELSRISGDNVGAALDAAARGVRAFTTAASSQAEVQDIGTSTAQASARLALIADKPLTDATGDVIASGSAFGLRGDQLDQVVDAVANAKRNVGGDAAQISQGLSLIALSAQEAGYGLNEAAAVIGLVQARTDQSGQAIATRLTRIFQITSGSTGKSLARELGVDANQSVKDQLAAYAEIYSNPDTSEGIRDRISSALGGTANLRELLPLLKENTTLQNAFDEALNNTGQGLSEYQRKSENLVGTLKKIAGDISNIQVNLAKSGLFDFVGGALNTLEPALYSLNLFLNTWNELPGPMKTVLGTLIDIGIAAQVVGSVSKTAKLFRAADEVADVAETATDVAEVAATQAAATASTAKAVAAEREAAATAHATTASTAHTVALEREAVATGTATVASSAGAGGRFATMRSGLGSIAAFALNPYVLGGTLALGGLAAYGSNAATEQKREELERQYLEQFKAISAAQAAGADSGALSTAATDLRSLAGQIRESNVEGLFDFLTGGYDDRKSSMINSLEQRADTLERIAEKVAREQARMVTAQEDLTIVGGGAVETVQQLAQGIDEMAANGATAVNQFTALAKALTTPPGEDVTTRKVAPTRLAAQIFAGLQSALPTAIDLPKVFSEELGLGFDDDEKKPTIGAYTDGGFVATRNGNTDEQNADARAAIAASVPFDDASFAEIQRRVQRSLTRQGVDSLEGLDNAALRAVLQDAVKGLDLSNVVTNDAEGRLVPLSESPERMALVLDRLVNLLGNAPGGEEAGGGNFLTRMFDFGGASPFGTSPFGIGVAQPSGPAAYLNNPTLSRNQILSLVTPTEATEDAPAWPSIQAYADAMLSAVPSSDDGTKMEAALKARVEFYQEIADRNTGRDVQSLELLIANAEHDYREAAVARIEDMRGAAETRAKSNRELRAIRLRFAKRAFAAAGDDRNIIESLMESMDRQTIEAVIDYQRTAREVARQAFLHAQQLVAQAAAILAINPLQGLAGFGQAMEGMVEKRKEFRESRRAFDAMIDVYRNNAAVTEDKATLPETGDSGPTAEEKAQQRADLIAAQAAARAARIGGGIASARAAIVSARAQLAIAQKGTTEYFQALASLYEAQWQMKDAVAAYHDTLRQLSGDFTDPVEQARDAVNAARERFRQAIAKDEKAAARLDLLQSETALEKAKWDQRLSDMQTAEQLGRISRATYLRYLQRESERMHDMRNKTRQQIDYMNQIDLALKDAKSQMEAQFNLGDIDTRGLVYQVRRFAAQARAEIDKSQQASSAASSVSTVNNQVTINGTDVREVRRILTELLGGTAQIHTTQTRRI